MEIQLHRKQKINDEGNLENIFSSFVGENTGFDLSWVSTLPSPTSPLPWLATAESNSHGEQSAPKANISAFLIKKYSTVLGCFFKRKFRKNDQRNRLFYNICVAVQLWEILWIFCAGSEKAERRKWL